MCVIDFIRGKSVKVKWKDDIKKKGQSLWIVPSWKMCYMKCLLHNDLLSCSLTVVHCLNADCCTFVVLDYSYTLKIVQFGLHNIAVYLAVNIGDSCCL